jgi:hypothetical protein
MVRGEQRAAEVARSTKPRAGECPSLSLHSRGSGSPIRSPPTACFWGRARKDGPRAAQASAGPLRIREVCAELSGGAHRATRRQRRFRELSEGPRRAARQVVTVDGKEVVDIVSAEEGERLRWNGPGLVEVQSIGSGVRSVDFPASRRIVVRCGRRFRTSSERDAPHGRRLSAWSGCAPGECGREVAWRAAPSVPGPGSIGARAGRTIDRLGSREARSV